MQNTWIRMLRVQSGACRRHHQERDLRCKPFAKFQIARYRLLCGELWHCSSLNLEGAVPNNLLQTAETKLSTALLMANSVFTRGLQETISEEGNCRDSQSCH